jgi:hypothetical protein
MRLLKTDFQCEDQAADYDWQVKHNSMAFIPFSFEPALTVTNKV